MTTSAPSALQNLYHRRLTSTPKPCTVCYKPSATVLITPDRRDWFYVCASHLSNTRFAVPVTTESDKDALEREIEGVKAEWAAKVRARAERRKEKGKGKGKGKKKGEKDDDEEGLPVKSEAGGEEEVDDKGYEERLKKLEERKGSEPRVYNLDRSVFQSRVNKLQMQVLAKRRKQQFGEPGFFPSVPGGLPG